MDYPMIYNEIFLAIGTYILYCIRQAVNRRREGKAPIMPNNHRSGKMQSWSMEELYTWAADWDTRTKCRHRIILLAGDSYGKYTVRAQIYRVDDGRIIVEGEGECPYPTTLAQGIVTCMSIAIQRAHLDREKRQHDALPG